MIVAHNSKTKSVSSKATNLTFWSVFTASVAVVNMQRTREELWTLCVQCTELDYNKKQNKIKTVHVMT